jgi:hypothetical protein
MWLFAISLKAIAEGIKICGENWYVATRCSAYSQCSNISTEKDTKCEFQESLLCKNLVEMTAYGKQTIVGRSANRQNKYYMHPAYSELCLRTVVLILSRLRFSRFRRIEIQSSVELSVYLKVWRVSVKHCVYAAPHVRRIETIVYSVQYKNKVKLSLCLTN